MQGNTRHVRSSWDELLSHLKDKWGDLTDDDLKVAEWNLDQLIGRIQKRTGFGRELIMQTVNEFSEGASEVARRASRAMSDMAARVTEQVHDGADFMRSQVSDGYEEARRRVVDRPIQSVVTAFGVGVGLGLLLGLAIRSR